MSRTDSIADALTHLKNSENAAHNECMIRPASKLLKEIFRILQAGGYIQSFEFVEDGREGMFRVKLAGKINEARAIKPRYAVGKNEFEKFEKKYLPAYDVGTIIVSTPQGVLTHSEAKGKNIGGRLLAYVY